MGACSYDIAANLFACTVNYDFLGSGETVSAVHLHWKSFVYQGVTIIPGRVVFPVAVDTNSGSATIPSGPPSNANLTLAFRANPSLSGGLFYINIHGTWSPPSPQGSMAGIVVGSSIHLGLNGTCNVATEMAITQSTTTSSAAAACSVPQCVYDLAAKRLNCSVNYDLGGAELAKAVHIHWKSFTYQGETIPTGRIVFNTNFETISGTSWFEGPVPTNMSLAILS
jgi:hypothetical protein